MPFGDRGDLVRHADVLFSGTPDRPCGWLEPSREPVPGAEARLAAVGRPRAVPRRPRHAEVRPREADPVRPHQAGRTRVGCMSPWCWSGGLISWHTRRHARCVAAGPRAGREAAGPRTGRHLSARPTLRHLSWIALDR